MDTKKFQRATEIMNDLKKLHERTENLKIANKLTFSHTHRGDVMDSFDKESPAFILCREIVVAETEKRIAQLEKEFNEL